MQYIHHSPCHFHGSLSTLTAVIDKRFTIKLCGLGATKLFKATVQCPFPDRADPVRLWSAPEMIFNTKSVGSKQADVYSLGIILIEVLTLQAPLDSDFDSQYSVTGNSALIL